MKYYESVSFTKSFETCSYAVVLISNNLISDPSNTLFRHTLPHATVQLIGVVDIWHFLDLHYAFISLNLLKTSSILQIKYR